MEGSSYYYYYQNTNNWFSLQVNSIYSLSFHYSKAALAETQEKDFIFIKIIFYIQAQTRKHKHIFLIKEGGTLN